MKASIFGGAVGQCAVSVKVPIDQDQWSRQCPHIECDADPAGGDLHPHRRPPAGDGLILGVRAADTHKQSGLVASIQIIYLSRNTKRALFGPKPHI